MVDADLLQSFVEEGRESLDEVEPMLIELGQSVERGDEPDPEILASIFRLVHSFKGSSSFLELTTVTSVTHQGETLLDLFRKGKARITPKCTDLLCRTLDLLRLLLERIEETMSDAGLEDEAAKITRELETAVERISSGDGASCSDSGEVGTGDNVQIDGDLGPAATGAQSPVADDWGADPEPADAAGPEDAADDTMGSPESGPGEGEFPEIEITGELRDKFVQEADELLDQAEGALLAIEKKPDNATEIVADALRCLHSIKGNAGFMGLAEIERLSHRSEEALEGMSAGAVECSQGNIATLLEILDVLRDAVADVSGGGRGAISAVDVLVELVGEMLPKAEPEPSVPAQPDTAPEQSDKAGQGNYDAEKTQPGSTAKSSNPRPGQSSGQAPVHKKITRRDIRVDITKLDALINLVGELVIAEAMVTRHPVVAEAENESLERAVHLLRRISSDLQDVAMSARMIPLAATFRKMIRLVHDLATKSGKKIELELLGEDTEVDKTVIEQIADPLVHIVRNACDHGIEPPADRVAMGKSETAQVTIEGRHEGGEVWIIISDNGRGLDRGKILAKGIERGLVEGDGEELTDEQVFKLIFEPGFSTADKVTDISGRGVGMDVVKKNIEKLKGKIDVKSELGKGSKFILRIPLTLAIIEGMMVRVGDARYTIPLLTIRESFRPTREQVTITPDGQEVVRVREDFFPIVRLHQVFQRGCDSEELHEGILVLVDGDGESIALLVDEILGQQETVIKGLSHFIGQARGISGCTILGDGQVSLILDVNGLVEMARE